MDMLQNVMANLIFLLSLLAQNKELLILFLSYKGRNYKSLISDIYS